MVAVKILYGVFKQLQFLHGYTQTADAIFIQLLAVIELTGKVNIQSKWIFSIWSSHLWELLMEKEEGLNRAWTLTSTILVHCSTSWAIRPTGSWLIVMWVDHKLVDDEYNISIHDDDNTWNSLFYQHHQLQIEVMFSVHDSHSFESYLSRSEKRLKNSGLN